MSFMIDKTFVDTNILVYAHDRKAGQKHATAVEHIRTLWEKRCGVLSTQVLQELFVNVTRKSSSPLSSIAAKRIIRNYLAWPVVVNDGRAILEAIDLQGRFRLSFWDALIVQSALSAGCATLLSEDLNSGQRYESLRVANPFLP